MNLRKNRWIILDRECTSDSKVAGNQAHIFTWAQTCPSQSCPPFPLSHKKKDSGCVNEKKEGNKKQNKII